MESVDKNLVELTPRPLLFVYTCNGLRHSGKKQKMYSFMVANTRSKQSDMCVVEEVADVENKV